MAEAHDQAVEERLLGIADAFDWRSQRTWALHLGSNAVLGFWSGLLFFLHLLLFSRAFQFENILAQISAQAGSVVVLFILGVLAVSLSLSYGFKGGAGSPEMTGIRAEPLDGWRSLRLYAAGFFVAYLCGVFPTLALKHSLGLRDSGPMTGHMIVFFVIFLCRTPMVATLARWADRPPLHGGES